MNSKTIVLTGVTGYLGSHLALQMLETFPNHTLICLARNKNGLFAEDRVVRAIQRAHHERGGAELPADILERLVVVDDNLVTHRTRRSGLQTTITDLIRCFKPDEFWHCAAAIAFTGEQNGAVWTANVEGLQQALSLASSVGVSVFNHISTAYVAGTRTGSIPETLYENREGFNNIYEHSKHHGEWLVDQHCRRQGMAYRIFRPSIIIGHSRTYRTSSDAGLYHGVDLMRQFHEKVNALEPGYFERNSLKVRVDPDATLNLIPIDIVVSEILDLNARGPETLDQVFHVTNEKPPSVLDVLRAGCGLKGIEIVPAADPGQRLGVVDLAFSKKMRLLSPYFSSRVRFERGNALRYGSDRHQAEYHVDFSRLKGFAQFYLDVLEGRSATPEMRAYPPVSALAPAVVFSTGVRGQYTPMSLKGVPA